MSSGGKRKFRGFVMTGGGAKGFYEAGVIHAFHITGMEFDVITGSSIGAMNSIFFAEYLYKKRSLPADVLADPEAAMEAMDRLMRQYHHAWLLMPTIKIIDDTENSPLGKLKDDLLKFNLSLPQLVRLGWWWSDPERGKIPAPRVITAGIQLVKEIGERLGDTGQVFRILKDHRANFLGEAIRTYLEKFGIVHSVVPDTDDLKLKKLFSDPVTPLTPEHLTGNVIEAAPDGESGLIDANRTMKDYMNVGLDVRLTRANYRTGRLEISNYLSVENFYRWFERQVWRLKVSDPNDIPLGSFRIQMPGNPNALNAALASGRFPGVFCPYPLRSIYPADDEENRALYDMLNHWDSGKIIKAALKDAYQGVHTGKENGGKSWKQFLKEWQEIKYHKDFFANLSDTYVDGGAIDNTPTNSVVDAVRETIDLYNGSKRDVSLQMFVIYLHTEPKVGESAADCPNTVEVVKRTLDIQSAARLSSDAMTVKTINKFGYEGEYLGRVLLRLIESVKAASGTDIQAIEETIYEHVRNTNDWKFAGEDAEGILDRMKEWSERKIARSLPLHVDEIPIYPEIMPLSTLNFSERLGYNKAKAIKMIAMGCYNTLWAMRKYFEENKEVNDDYDAQILELAKSWMDIEKWPKQEKGKINEYQEKLDQLSGDWKCKRTQCLYHAEHCPHGRKHQKRIDDR